MPISDHERARQITHAHASGPGRMSEIVRILADDDLTAALGRRDGDGQTASVVAIIMRQRRERVFGRWEISRQEAPAAPARRGELDGLEQVLGETDRAHVAANRRTVLDMQRLLFEQHRVDEAIDRYFRGDMYLQHAPGAPDGVDFIRDGFRRRFAAHPHASSRLRHLIADDDLVLVHREARQDPGETLRLVCDVFRLVEGRIVEHWDVTQTAPDAVPRRPPGPANRGAQRS